MSTFFGSMMDFNNASKPEGPDPIQPVPIQPVEEPEPKAENPEPKPEPKPAPAKTSGTPLTPVKEPVVEDTEEKEEPVLSTGTYNPFGAGFMEQARAMAASQAPEIAEPTASMTEGFIVKGEKVEVEITEDSARIDSELHGTIHCHDLYIGTAEIDGTIASDKTVVLSKDAKVTGDIHAKCVHVYGTFSGDLVSEERLVIHKSADISGTTKAFGTVEIHPGAVLNGTAAFTAAKAEEPKEEPEDETPEEPKEETTETVEPVSDDAPEIHPAEELFPEKPEEPSEETPTEPETPAESEEPAEEEPVEEEAPSETPEETEPEAETEPEEEAEPSEEAPAEETPEAESETDSSEDASDPEGEVKLPDSFFDGAEA